MLRTISYSKFGTTRLRGTMWLSSLWLTHRQKGGRGDEGRLRREALHPVLKDADEITFSKEQLKAYGHTLPNKSLTVNHATIPREIFQKHPYAKVSSAIPRK